jgi:hypothetical protein
VGGARRTTATITQPGITALERHFENLKVLAFVLARSSERTRGAGVKQPTPLPHPTSEKGGKVYWYYWYYW